MNPSYENSKSVSISFYTQYFEINDFSVILIFKLEMKKAAILIKNEENSILYPFFIVEIVAIAV